MKRIRRNWIIGDLVERIERSKLVLVTHVGHVPGTAVDGLRKDLNAAGGGLKLVKGSLGRQAAVQLGLPTVAALFGGPSALLHSDESSDVETAKIALKFAQANPEFLILGGKLQGQELLHTHVDKLVSLVPETVYGELIGMIHPAAHAGRIVTMIDPSTHLQLPRVSQYLALTLNAYVRREEGEAGGAGSPPAP
ncbi:hypothetical protein KFE25_000843 [Diacronema lutheri]|mgnify:CR=1 FL=1|uniref:50S ribosomal protein L10 n=1 Tax=Diacronema lutheri TaxID=2081491 RepID=A0A8J6CAE0_DIALT|nr:hypothetical protein KFE25_000843 [Diacronema lutheri]